MPCMFEICAALFVSALFSFFRFFVIFYGILCSGRFQNEVFFVIVVHPKKVDDFFENFLKILPSLKILPFEKTLDPLPIYTRLTELLVSVRGPECSGSLLRSMEQEIA